MESSTPGEPSGYGHGVFDVESVRQPVDGEVSPSQRIVSNPVVSRDPPDGVERTSNRWIAAAYNITAIIGVGVLGLPNAMVFLTWGGGPVVLVLAFIITFFTIRQLIKLHEFELLKKGIRYSTYTSLGKRAFQRFEGDKLGFWIILPLQMIVEVSLDILFTVAAGEAMNRIYDNLHKCNPLHIFVWFAIFATIQIVLSFVVRTFESIRWIVITAAIMSICYSMIAWITLSVKDRAPHVYYTLPPSLPVDNSPAYSPSGQPELNLTSTDKVFQAFNAVGVVAFAFAAHNIVLEIQNGIPSTSHQSSEKEMLRGVWITYAVVAVCYFPMGIAVYGVHGNKISNNVLSFMFGNAPSGLAIAANFMLIIHLIGSYQIFALPVFKQLEYYFEFKRSWSPSTIKSIRPIYIVSTTAVAMVFPYFSPLLGFFGGFAIAPTTYFLPCVIWLFLHPKSKEVIRWKSKDWYFNWVCIILGVILMIVASIGRLAVLIKEWQTSGYYKLWSSSWTKSKYYPIPC